MNLYKRFSKLTNLQLGYGVCFGGIFVCATGLVMHWKIASGLATNVYYKEALEILRSHEGAKKILGTPIKDKNVSLDRDDINWATEREARFCIPVYGPTGHGHLYLHAKRPVLQWELQRCELKIEQTKTLKEEQYKSKRLLIFDRKKVEEEQKKSS